MKKIWVLVLLISCSSLFAQKDDLQITESSNEKVVLSTSNVPDHAMVRVECILPLKKNRDQQNWLYVLPKTGAFAKIGYYSGDDAEFFTEVGSKISIGPHKSSFSGSDKFYYYIFNVTNLHEQIILDISHAPDVIYEDVECFF